MTCKDCKYYQKYAYETSTSGDCRRYPPTVYYEPVNPHNDSSYPQQQQTFPTVGDNEWCGEFVDVQRS